jgi:hypothetical protein
MAFFKRGDDPIKNRLVDFYGISLVALTIKNLKHFIVSAVYDRRFWGQESAALPVIEA